MNFNFKKIASALSSALMVSSTVALAAAANYPAPFVSNGRADVAIVVGDNAATTDSNVAAAALSADLSTHFASQGGSRGTSTPTPSGESYPLFTTSSQLFLNSTLNTARDTLTDQQLPTLLEDGTLEGDSSYTYEQRIVLGSNPQVTFAQMPTSNDDPTVGISISTSASTSPVYNSSLIFDGNANFTHADTIGEDFEIFGQKYTVGAGTTTTKLVLLKSSQTIDLASDTNPTASVDIDGVAYTVELVSATDSSATIRVTDSTGRTDRKEINEASSKKILGLEVSVDLADENNNRVTASISVGSDRVTLQDGTAVKIGSDEDTIDGTNVKFYLANGTTTTYTGAIGKIDFQVAADDSDRDAIFEGQSFTDPIFGSFRIDFTGLNIPLDDTENRETIDVSNSGNDKMTVRFQSADSNEPNNVNYVYNRTTAEGGGQILADNNGNGIRVAEKALVNKSQYFVFADRKSVV